MSPIGDALARDDREPLQKRFDLLTPMRFDDSDDDVEAFGFLGLRRRRHFIGLADAWRSVEKYLQAALLLSAYI